MPSPGEPTRSKLIEAVNWTNADLKMPPKNKLSDRQIADLTRQLDAATAERDLWERRVKLLRSERVDPDMLDERARFQLDYVNPRDLIRTLKPN